MVVASKFLIYALCDPRTGEVRYVGKTESAFRTRLNHHIFRARKGEKHHVYCWIRKLLSEGVRPEMELVEECFSHEDLAETERFYIAYFRSLGFRLTNHTEGGEGCIGYKHTDEARARMSAIQRGRKRALRGPMPTEHRLKISRTKSGLTEAQQRNVVDAYIGGENSDQVAARFGVSATCVIGLIRIAGLKMRTQPESLRKLDNEQRREVVRLYTEEFLSSNVIAAQMGMSGSAILTILRQLGIPRRSSAASRWLTEAQSR